MENIYKTLGVGSHAVRAVPNIHNVSKNVLSIEVTTPGAKYRPNILHFAYLLVDGSVGLYRVNKPIADIFGQMLRGELIASASGRIRNKADEDSDEEYIGKGPLNPFDIRTGYKIAFDIQLVKLGEHSLNKLHNFTLLDDEAMWSPGDDKDNIMKLYDGLPTLEDALENFKEQNPDLLYGTDATKNYYESIAV